MGASFDRGDLLFIAGQVAVDPGGKLVGKEDSAVQITWPWRTSRRCWRRLGPHSKTWLKLNIYVTDMSGKQAMGQERLPFLKEPCPTSTQVGVRRLANPDFMVEIEAVAAL